MITLPRRGVRLRNERYEEIKADIIDMYEECEVHVFPLDAFEIADKLRYNVFPYSQLPLEKRAECRNLSKDGCSELDLNPATGMYEYNIFYNDAVGTLDSRIQFTIMHEIGHIRLGHLDDDSDKPEDEMESEANFYAAYGIAPPPMIDFFDCESPEDISECFHISAEMSGYAYQRYRQWLRCGVYYKDYEIHMINLFNVA